MTDNKALREAVARIIDPSTWAVLDSYLADAKRKYVKSNASYDPDAFKDKKSLAKADAILAMVYGNPGDWREHLLNLLKRSREYVTDSLEAHEHTDGRELLAEVDEALGRDAEYCYIKTMQTDTALSLIQPEIDRRVAEEKARLLEALREPSEGMAFAGANADAVEIHDADSATLYPCRVWQAMLTAFQQENSDAATDR